ncbi:multiple inositol polyphosphate phosphatase 1 [Anopheles cruzii]|uniref:multiple inositol polyphosphate phosphatase 1 n=1 Tax=Anopheles cruzii TaxID=68878 RepID=UPI0022EC4A4C|nr:multiple inositol polyphosphate phosphatase 1 [Anopheles cruzii]XP_052860127.1 multiple inositol polyphosphate phosphatase 1 [Anopheles cruzii]
MILRVALLPTVLLGLVNVSIAQRSDCCESYCYNDDHDRTQVQHFATKTAYEVIRIPDTDKQHIVPNCRPVKLWSLNRHGTRLPSKGDIQKLPRLLKMLQDAIMENYFGRRTLPDNGRMCEEDLELLRGWNWNPNITEQYESVLTTAGWEEVKYFALRTKNRYWDIIGPTYEPKKYLFRHTNAQRTEASFKAFVEGLFGTEEAKRVKPVPASDPDRLLKPYDYCPDYANNKARDERDENAEANKFTRTPLFISTVWDISQRLGFRHNLSVEQIDAMWSMCRFEQAWHLSMTSPFCSAFTKDQVRVLEYKEDLQYYYSNSYGYQHSQNLACHAVADMLKHLGTTEEPLMVSYFTHDSELQLFLAALGAKRDHVPLRADNFATMRNRQYTSSNIPFAANIVAVKYQCTEPQEPVKVIFFLNERPIMLDWCRVGLCNWSDVKRQYQRFSEGNCDQMFCFGSGASEMRLSFTIFLLGATTLVAWTRLSIF